MMSLSLRRKAKLTPPSCNIADDREGIFDQFSEDSNKELYYYAVYSSSDSEGNITVHGVKREKFDSDVKAVANEDERDDEMDSEPENTEPRKGAVTSKNRYGFRKRRLMRRARDEEFDTSLCNTSDESGADEYKYAVSSDDETYDITADNWAYVRGAKKKSLDGQKKKSDQIKKTKFSPRKTTSLKIKFKPKLYNGKRTKFQKLATMLRKRPLIPPKLKIPAASRQTVDAKPIPEKEQVEKKAETKKEIAQLPKTKRGRPRASIPTGTPKEDSPLPGTTVRSNFLKSLSAASAPNPPFPQKSPTRIRCGYNPAATKIAPQLRHVRRRQLRQTPSRMAENEEKTFEDGSSSSDEETSIAMKTRGRRLSRMLESRRTRKAVRNNRSVEAPSTDKKMQNKRQTTTNSGESATVSSSGNGLKLVIRRQSIEQHNKTIPQSESRNPEGKIAKISNKERLSKRVEHTETNEISSHSKYSEPAKVVSGVSNGKKVVVRTVKLKRSPSISDKSEPKTLDSESALLPLGQATASDAKNNEQNTKKLNNGDEASGRTLQEAQITDQAADTSSTLAEAKSNSSVANNKTSSEDEGVKKKKSKKKKKKDRGRTGSSAGTEDAFDAQHTAMRLAMDLPRHNWLVKHLIKENKIKAEDDKPLNLPEDSEGSPTLKGSPTQLLLDTNTVIKQTPQHTPGDTDAETFLSQRQESTSSPVHQENVNTRLSVLAKIDATQKSDGAQADDSRKHSNNVKGSSMVGIVKPFQHLKMSPSNMASTEMSPPPLCIVDEEESANQTAENSSGPNMIPCDTPSESVHDNTSNISGRKSCLKDKELKNHPIVPGPPTCPPKSSCSQKSTGITRQEIVSAAKMQVPVYNTTLTVNVAEMETKSLKDLPEPTISAKTNALKETQIESDSCRTSPSQTGSAQKPGKDEVAATVETEQDIKISNCFSLALDLTKKVEVKTEVVKEVSDDQPLDLSLGPKCGDVSPKILDLSFKKPSQIKKPPKTPTLPKALKEFEKISPSKSQSLHIVIQPHPTPAPTKVAEISKTETKPNEICKNSQSKTEGIIVIDDDSIETKFKPQSHKTLPSTKISTEVEQHQTTTPKKNSKEAKASNKTPPQTMKRSASYDSPAVKAPSAPKRARMSLDDSKKSDPGDEDVFHLQQKLIQEPSRQPVVVPFKEQNSKMSADSPNKIPNEPSAKAPVAAGNRSLSDLLGVNRPTYVSAAYTELKSSPKSSLPQGMVPVPSIPTPKSISRTSPLSVLPQPIFAPRSSPMRQIRPIDFNNNVRQALPGAPRRMPSPQLPPSDPHVQRRAARHRSLEFTNATAQMVAQTYQPDIQQLGPYIKEQQIAVDKKIQELEAIKRQLANAQKISSNPLHKNPTSYNQALQGPQLPKIFAPPPNTSSSLQIRSSVPTDPRMKMLPTTHVPQPKIMPTPSYPSSIAPIHSLPIQQGPIAQPQHIRPPIPSHIRATTVEQIQHRRPTQLPAPPTSWRMMPPRSEPPRPLYQRSLSSGGQAVHIDQRGVIRQPHQAHVIPPQGPIFSPRTTTTSQRLISTQETPTYRHRPPIPQIQSIPVPRIPAPTTTVPFYRNGGLTIQDSFRTKLNEPIVIEDDIMRHPGSANIRKRQIPQATPDSLKIRRAHSYHPPLSKNRVEQSITQSGSNPHWSDAQIPSKFGVPQAPSVAASQTEICVKCQGKAFFLCSGCRKMWYCSKECQLKDWTVHSAICSG